ncbi:DUF3048 domain-containing protein [Acetatifactor muris]|uniref:Lipoprotein YerB n=1 Tax=Acetatifactor muris TaxID=879566 RepID=A0A2K4ZEB9_9FIRM|nr:DUF3048 domain-containing protein [Acetatifactor muris]MCR2047189.1 DUF3048 domain-containing protein [Acetatifactor muris]SOY28800.1 Putative lipoprotein YerB precursor [Acetatifactor muris]
MKKKVLAVIIAAMAVLAGCGGEGGEPQSPVQTVKPVVIVDEPEVTSEPTEELTTTPEPEEDREGMYRSELTNEWIDESLQNQRPIAVMVDNEKTALPHYGLTQADVVYEIMNSTANGRVTRFMAIVKDWGSLTQFGSIRSTRETNIYLVGEWNAILCHDGGPYFVMGNSAANYKGLIAQKDYCDNLSGIFPRVENGKPSEFTEYIVQDDRSVKKSGKTVAEGISSKGYSVEYNEYYIGPHFKFSSQEYDLSGESGSFGCNEIQLKPFEHNNSRLEYNEATGTYDYYEYGEAHLDPENGNAQLTFENLIIQKCSFSVHEPAKEGYFIYNCLGSGEGYFITNGTAIDITWEKGGEAENGSGASLTVFRNKATGEEIVLNTGKTYIALVPDDTWNTIVIK